MGKIDRVDFKREKGLAHLPPPRLTSHGRAERFLSFLAHFPRFFELSVIRAKNSHFALHKARITLKVQ